ncbi:MAG: class I SAM-dependent methyltransferase [Parasphingorhabdus sp.]
MLKLIARQARHPKGVLGHLIARIMTKTTAYENSIAVNRLNVMPGDDVLELGCGHGYILKQIIRKAYPGRVVGVDPSLVMLSVASRRLKDEVGSQNASLLVGDSDHIPVEDGGFDKALSVHTIYFWSELQRGCQSLRRILRREGELLLVCHGADGPERLEHFPDEIYKFQFDDDMKLALVNAGFRDVDISIGADDIRYISAVAA